MATEMRGNVRFIQHPQLTEFWYCTWPFGELHWFESPLACQKFAAKHAVHYLFEPLPTAPPAIS